MHIASGFWKVENAFTWVLKYPEIWCFTALEKCWNVPMNPVCSLAHFCLSCMMPGDVKWWEIENASNLTPNFNILLLNWDLKQHTAISWPHNLDNAPFNCVIILTKGKIVPRYITSVEAEADLGLGRQPATFLQALPNTSMSFWHFRVFHCCAVISFTSPGCESYSVDVALDWLILKHVTNVHATNIATVTMNQTPERKNKKHRKIET